MQHFCIKDKITAAQKTNVESLALRIRTLMFTQSNDQIDQFCLCYKRKGHVIQIVLEDTESDMREQSVFSTTILRSFSSFFFDILDKYMFINWAVFPILILK